MSILLSYGLSFELASGHASPASPESTEPEVPTVVTAVHVTFADETGSHPDPDRIRRIFQNAADAALSTKPSDELPTPHAEDQLNVNVRLLGTEPVRYAIDIACAREPNATVTTGCDVCTEPEVAAKIADEVASMSRVLASPPAAIPVLETRPLADSPSNPDRHPETGPEPEPVQVVTPPHSDSARPHLVRNTGLGLTIGGGVVGLTGVGLFVADGRGEQPIDGGLEGDVQRNDTQLPGIVLMAVGGAAALTGAILLGVDASKKKRKAMSKHARVVPTWAPVTLRIRF